MKTKTITRRDRREFLRAAGAAAAGLVLVGRPFTAQSAETPQKLKIGVIGSGNVGSTLGRLWIKAGHEVMFSSLDIKHDRQLAASIGAGARSGTPREAATFGAVLFFAVPYTALPGLGRELAAEIKGKIVLDASNPIPNRDGSMAQAALDKGAGIASQEFLAGARIVRAYNEVGFGRMRDDAHRAGERLGIPLAGDDAQALNMAVRLVQDAGHEPVVVGGLARAREFDFGSSVFGKPMTAAELKRALNLSQ